MKSRLGNLACLAVVALVTACLPVLAVSQANTTKNPVFSIGVLDNTKAQAGGDEYASHIFLEHPSYAAIIIGLRNTQLTREDLKRGVSAMVHKTMKITREGDWTQASFGDYPGDLQECTVISDDTPLAEFNCAFIVNGQPFVATFLTTPDHVDVFTQKLIPGQLGTVALSSAAGLAPEGLLPTTRGAGDFPKMKIDGSLFRH